MLSPLLTLIFYPQEATNLWAFAIPASSLGILGLLLWRFFRTSLSSALTIQDGGVIVLLSWIGVILFSAWPVAEALNMDYSRAVFESVSGWTTTGLSVVDVTSAGPMILLWRSVMQLAGGAGLAIIMMSAIVGPTGVGVSSAEGRSEQLVPHVRQSARLVLIIYSGYALAGVLAYKLAGMDLFDAINHSFAAVSTGGFSTRVESIGYWDSVAVESVTIPLMLLGNLSFATAWLLLQGDLRSFSRNGEIRLIAALIPFSFAVLFIFTCSGLYPVLGKSLRVAVFESVTALTTTGFSTVSYEKWNPIGAVMLIVLMQIGGGTCSTAGGIKQFRIYTLWKLLLWEIRRPFIPRTAIVPLAIWEGRRQVFLEDARALQIGVFVFLYLITLLAGVMILCACGYPVRDSLFEFASAIGTVGLSVGITSANMHSPALWAETIAMFLGRLEFIVVIVSIMKMGKDARLILRRGKSV
ncbi:MAG: TrkH family potassium uptake protein [Desulfobacteraceae bacterium]|nr:MAG: TrkH family potassium uptake protein [Desulfobacteraceae bacterium]